MLSPRWQPLEQLHRTTPLHPLILEAALWAFHDATNFRHAVLRAVNPGDDADTTGAVCGQLAGAYWGESGIPADLLSELARRDLLESALNGILSA